MPDAMTKYISEGMSDKIFEWICYLLPDNMPETMLE
jgi:hypothetical protein